MTKVFHVIGAHGVGRSTLCWALAVQRIAKGERCEVFELPDGLSRAEALVLSPKADCIFLEHLPGAQFDVEKGDVLISMVRAEAGGRFVQAGSLGWLYEASTMPAMTKTEAAEVADFLRGAGDRRFRPHLAAQPQESGHV